MSLTPKITRKAASVLLIACGLLTSCSKDGGGGDLFSSFGSSKKWETLVSEGKDFMDKGKLVEAEAAYKEAYEACKKKFGEEDARTGTCVGYLAGFYQSKQDWPLAYQEYKHWKIIMEKVDPAGDQLKQIDEDLRKVKEKMKQYGLVPDDVLKRRAEKAEKEAQDKDKDGKGDKTKSK